jgi:hypothetical protein
VGAWGADSPATLSVCEYTRTEAVSWLCSTACLKSPAAYCAWVSEKKALEAFGGGRERGGHPPRRSSSQMREGQGVGPAGP